MLHDNFDDILARPDLYPTVSAKRSGILEILPIYLHRNHGVTDFYPDFHEPPGGAQMEGHGGMAMTDMGPRPPSVEQVLSGKAPASDQSQPSAPKPSSPQHKH
jgi:hypothetical protein